MRHSRNDAKPRVLVIEPDPTNLELMSELLTAMDHEPILAANAREARELLDRDARPVQVLLTEISLESREDGLALARELRADEQWQRLPIVAVTGRAFPTDGERALEAGCNAYLTKPFSLGALSEILADFRAESLRAAA